MCAPRALSSRPTRGWLSGGEHSAGGWYAPPTMRSWPAGGVLAFGLLAALPACTDVPLVKVVLAYEGFEPACVQVMASNSDGSNPHPPTPVHVPPQTRQGELQVTVWGQSGWGDQLLISAEAHELSCAGNVVADDRSTVSVTAGQTATLPLALRASDADQDGYVAGPRGTD